MNLASRICLGPVDVLQHHLFRTMVLRILPDRGLCRPKRVVSNDDVDSSRNDSDRVRCPSVTRDAIRTESRVSINNLDCLIHADAGLLQRILQDLGNHHNAQVSEVIYRLNSGEIFLVNESHPEPQQLHLEGSLIGLLSRSHQSPSKGLTCHVLARFLTDFVCY